MLISALTVAAVYVVRRSENDDPKSNFSVPGYPYTPAIYILLVIFSWIQTLQKQPMPAIYAIVTVAAGVGVYYIGRARGWITTSPAPPPKTETLETDQ
jgi:APA family basic amino acid/polyamine antiporter